MSCTRVNNYTRFGRYSLCCMCLFRYEDFSIKVTLITINIFTQQWPKFRIFAAHTIALKEEEASYCRGSRWSFTTIVCSFVS